MEKWQVWANGQFMNAYNSHKEAIDATRTLKGHLVEVWRAQMVTRQAVPGNQQKQWRTEGNNHKWVYAWAENETEALELFYDSCNLVGLTRTNLQVFTEDNTWVWVAI